MKKRIVFCGIAVGLFYFYASFSPAILHGNNDSNVTEEEEVSEVREVVENEDDDFILLSDVSKPVWDSPYAVLQSGDSFYEADWGYSSENLTIADSSAFPGFNHSILIYGSDVGELNGELSLFTDYGSWSYGVVDSKSAVLNDSKDNVVDILTGEEMVNYATSEENLYVYDQSSKTVYVAELRGGTRISG